VSRAEKLEEKMEAIPKPGIGRIVHFVSSGGIHHASLITRVKSDTEVDLNVFTAGEDGSVSETGCLFDGAGLVVGSWHWPERIN
jgi:hypothetical protein